MLRSWCGPWCRPRGQGWEAGGCGHLRAGDDFLSSFLPLSGRLWVGAQTSELWLDGDSRAGDWVPWRWPLPVLSLDGHQAWSGEAPWVHTGPRQCPERWWTPASGCFFGLHPAPRPHLPRPGPRCPCPPLGGTKCSDTVGSCPPSPLPTPERAQGWDRWRLVPESSIPALARRPATRSLPLNGRAAPKCLALC